MKNISCPSVLVVGSSSGLGRELTIRLIEEGHRVLGLSRRVPQLPSSLIGFYTHLPVDLVSTSELKASLKSTNLSPINKVCFCQRYREDAKTNLSPLKEYVVNVLSTSLILDSLLESSQANKSNLNVVVVGSSYSFSAGLDQSFSYHACKHALMGLVRYYAVNTDNSCSINLVSPPTYIKRGAEEYWRNTSKSHLWSRLPHEHIPHVEEVISALLLILNNPINLMNGQNIVLDGGTSVIYPDQIFQNSES